MTRMTRAITALTLVILFASNLSPVARGGTSQQDSGKTIIISGTTGVGGVTLKGLPSECVSDSDGKFSVEVSGDNVSGHVMPIKEGYTFDPPFVSFNSLAGNCTILFTARVTTFKISGSVGLAGVVMEGLPNRPITDARGFYACTVEYGWSGTVRPTREGYTFEPTSKLYNRADRDYEHENYMASVVTFTISGSVGVPDVRMLGLPGEAVTDADGRYETSLPYGWSGRATPMKEGYTFGPPARSYEKITSDRRDENYRARVVMLTIRDRIA
ncbi:MAG: hypothetical protein JW741_02890, partial [Sedimentisphaerales bacterium]|nr:hypothetical protein [Sedimentisphaerales bacterium]